LVKLGAGVHSLSTKKRGKGGKKRGYETGKPH